MSSLNSFAEIITPNVMILWNEWKKLQLKLESVQVCRGSSHACHAWSFPTNMKKTYACISWRKACLLYYLAERRKVNSTLRQPIRSEGSSSTNVKPPYFALPASPKGPFVYHQPPPPAPFNNSLLNQLPLPCSPDLSVICHSLGIPNCNSSILE